MTDNIILIGFMGSGKSSVGKLLAKELNFEFIDTDEEIEKANDLKISKIFKDFGEEYFRELETSYLKKLLLNKNDLILSTGGGLPLRDSNVKILRELGVVVYLKATKDTIVKRVKDDNSRPLLASDHLEERVDSLLRSRESCYQAAAHIEINTDDKFFTAIISEILEQYHLITKVRKPQ